MLNISFREHTFTLNILKMREWNKLCGGKGWNVGNFAYL